MLQVNNLTGGYDGKKAVIKDLSFSIEQGRFFALIGPNGSGKTTIIRLIMGALPVHDGEILLGAKPLGSYSQRELAKKAAVMTQENEAGLDFSVEEIVMLGRYPYQKALFFKENTVADLQAAETAMKQTSVWEYRKRPYHSLSGGEKQRVLLAKALAQEPELLLLDEPTNHLDVKHTKELLELLKKLQKDMNLTILAILHDLNLASLYADSIGLLNNGELEGKYEDLHLQNENTFSNVYEVKLNFTSHPSVSKTQISLSPEYMAEKPVNLLSAVQIQQTERAVYIKMQKPFRTLSAGDDGKGLHWSRQWIFSQAEQSDIGESIFFSSKQPYILWSLNENLPQNELQQNSFIVNQSGYTFCAIVSHSLYDGKVHAAILTDAPIDDANLINLALKLNAVKWQAEQNFGNIVVGIQKKEQNQADLKRIFEAAEDLLQTALKRLEIPHAVFR